MRVRRTRVVEAEPDVVEPAEAVAPDQEQESLDTIEARYRERATSPLKAIRAFCVLCLGCQPRMVVKCTSPTCVLYPFRMGKNPYQKRGPVEVEDEEEGV